MKKIGLKLPEDIEHSSRGVGKYIDRFLPHLIGSSSKFGLEINTFSHVPDSDLDLIHYPYFDIYNHTLPIIKSKPTVLSILDLIPLQYPEHYPAGIKAKFNFLLQKISVQNVKKFITISQFSKKQIIEYLNVPSEKIEVVYLAAEKIFSPRKNGLSEIHEKYSLPNKFVLYVGDVNWNKNLWNLAQASLSSGFPLVIVGKNAKDPQNLHHVEMQPFNEWLRQFGRLKEIHRLGYVPDEELVGIYNLASVYCQPSFVEGFGLPLLEAMACGTPCISSDRSSLPEVGGDAVLYFDPEKTDEMEELIINVVNNKNLSKRLKDAGIKRSQKFTWEKVANQLLTTYSDLLK
jgi:glycosyltransferase involved in cell wall biosynthesis